MECNTGPNSNLGTILGQRYARTKGFGRVRRGTDVSTRRWPGKSLGYASLALVIGPNEPASQQPMRGHQRAVEGNAGGLGRGSRHATVGRCVCCSAA